MWLMVFQMFAECHPGNYGGAVSRAEAGPHRGTAKFAVAGLVLMLSAVVSAPAKAQQPGFDPRQTEKRFDELQSGRTPADRSALRMPRLSRPEVAADTKPLFQLHGVSLTGAQAICL